jgi:dihydrofolate reductase
LLFASDALLLGRVTYQEFVASWPLRSGDPFTYRMNSMPKFVASTSLEAPLEWNSTLLEGDVAEEVRRLKQRPAQDLLVYGSGALVGTLVQHDLVDVWRLMLYPLVLASRALDAARLVRPGLLRVSGLSNESAAQHPRPTFSHPHVDGFGDGHDAPIIPSRDL